MDITNAQYIADDEGENIAIKITTTDGGVMVPINAVGNRHYDEIQRQVAEGTLTIADAE